jgi:hypothetical protein
VHEQQGRSASVLAPGWCSRLPTCESLAVLRPIAIAIAIAIVGLGCTSPAALVPATGEVDPPGGIELDDDSLGTEPEVEPLLAESALTWKFAFVRLGKMKTFRFGRKRGGFVETIEQGGPALLVDIWYLFNGRIPTNFPPTFDLDAIFGTREQRERADEAQLVVLDPAEYGLSAPDMPLWLIGPEGPCRARLGKPMLGRHNWTETPEVVELSWQLILDDPRSGCELHDPEQWSQIAVFAESLPSGLRFVVAEQRADGRVELESWSSPFAELVRQAVANSEAASTGRVDEVWVREVIVPGTDFIELNVAIIRREHDPCEDWQENRVLVGRWQEGKLESVLGDLESWERDNSNLHGAVMLDEQIAWTIHDKYRVNPIVHVPGRSPSIELDIGVFEEPENSYLQVESCAL